MRNCFNQKQELPACQLRMATDQAIATAEHRTIILMRSEGRQARKCIKWGPGHPVERRPGKQSRWAMNIKGNVNVLPAHASL